MFQRKRMCERCGAPTGRADWCPGCTLLCALELVGIVLIASGLLLAMLSLNGCGARAQTLDDAGAGGHPQTLPQAGAGGRATQNESAGGASPAAGGSSTGREAFACR